MHAAFVDQQPFLEIQKIDLINFKSRIFQENVKMPNDGKFGNRYSSSFTVSEGGEIVAYDLDYDTSILYDLKDFGNPRRFFAPYSTAQLISEKNNQLISGNFEGGITIFDLNRGTVLKNFNPMYDIYESKIEFSPDNNHFLTNNYNGEHLRNWNYQLLKPQGELKVGSFC